MPFTTRALGVPPFQTSRPGLRSHGSTTTPRAATTSVSTPEVFQGIENLIATNFNRDEPGGRLDWRQIDRCWVLEPPSKAGKAEAVVVFVGGAFVGAAPELSYKLFLEALSVIAIPYATSFDLQYAANEIQDTFHSCMEKIESDVRGLPVYGVGHSTGALLMLLINSRFPLNFEGNVLLGYNNRSATDVIPFLTPMLEPGARAMGPLLSQAASSPINAAATSMFDTMKSMSPSVVQMALPVLEQFSPMFMDVAYGRKEFTPSPSEAEELIQSYYSTPRTLLMRFRDDDLDETAKLLTLLQESTISNNHDITLRSYSGGQTRPMTQNFLDVPTPVARVASSSIKTSGVVFGSLSNVAKDVGWDAMESPLKSFGRSVEQSAELFGGSSGGPVTDSVTNLADEIAAWMAVGDATMAGRNVQVLAKNSKQ